MTFEDEIAELNAVYWNTKARCEELEQIVRDARELLLVCSDVLSHDVPGGATGLTNQIDAWQEQAKGVIGEEESESGD